MNCKVSRPSILNDFCTVLNSTPIAIKFKQMFHIKFYAKYNWNFGGFLRLYNVWHKYTLNISNTKNAQQNYLSIELLPSLLAAFFVEKIGFVSIFFQIQNLGWGYIREKLKLEAKVSLCAHFRGYLHEKLIFWKKLNWIWESSTSLMT